MSQHTLIRNAIATMEQGAFQSLCAHYLARTANGDLQTPGSVDENDKTRKGRPDIFMLLPDGTYLLAECTTKHDRDKTQFLGKLKADLEGCLDFKSLGLAQEQVKQITLCFNSTIDTIITEELTNMVSSSGVTLRFLSLTTLSEFLYSVDRVYARDELGIPFDTGQVLDKQTFLKYYRKRDLATPLDNPIIGRETQITDLANLIEKREIVIMTGPAGVGKSRLALQAMDVYCANHADAVPYYIFNKSGGITDDLLTYIQAGGHYILLLDDANRKPDNLIAALESGLSDNTKVRIIVTVRDYAVRSIVECCRNTDFERFHVSELDREVIYKLLTVQPFQVNSDSAIERILTIANGNARLAIMAANVFLKAVNLDAIADVSQIYDRYFAPVIDDLVILHDNLHLRILGLISFFNTIDVEMEFDQGILQLFGISTDQFLEAANHLESQEIVEIYQHTTVKITEQVLATYLFNEVFFRKRLLSFELLLNTYFSRNHARFTDTVTPAIQAFGRSIIDDNLQVLLSYWDNINADQSEAYKFLFLFGPYLPEQTLAFASAVIRDTPDNGGDFVLPKHFHYSSGYPHDPVLSLLAQFYNRTDDKLTSSLALACRYVTKQKESLAKVIDHMKTSFALIDQDVPTGFNRQKFIMNWLIGQFDKSQEARLIYYHVFYHLLINRFYGQEYYCQTGNGPAFIDAFRDLRLQFWQKTFAFAESDRPFVTQLLLDYIDQEPHLYPFMVYTDLPEFEELIIQKLDPGSFTECYFVNEYKKILSAKGIVLPDASSKRIKKFRTPLYSLFEKLTFRSTKYHERFTTTEAFQRLEERKSKDLNKMLPIADLASFEHLYVQAEKIYSFPDHSKTDLSTAFGMILNHAFETNTCLGFELLEFYLTKEQHFLFNPYQIYHRIFKHGTESTEQLYKLLHNVSFRYKQNWLERFFDWLPDEQVTHTNMERLLLCYCNASNGIKIHHQYFSKYESKRPGIMAELLQIIGGIRDKNPEFRYELGHDFFRTFDYLVREHGDLSIKIYLQQEDIDMHYDLYADEFFFIFEINSAFFRCFFDHMIDKIKQTQRDIGKYLSKIWNYDQAEELVFAVLVRLKELNYYSYINHPASVFFIQLTEERQKRAINVIKKLISSFPDDRQNTNIALDIVRHTLPLYFDDIIRHIVSTNPDLEFFDKLGFYPNHFSSNGKWQIWADYKAEVLRDVAEAIRSLANSVDYLEHQELLSRKIHIQKENADWERKLIFRGFR